MKNQRGITLIALVITIIVLLILAGVSIAMLTGDNGILTNASEAQDLTDQNNAIEKINIALQSIKTEALAQQIADAEFNPSNSEDVQALVTAEVTGLSASETAASETNEKYYIDTSTAGTITISYANTATGTDVEGSIVFVNGKGTITGATQQQAVQQP